MIGEKVQHFQRKATNLASLREKVEDSVKSERGSVQDTTPRRQGVVIQAPRGGFLDEVIAGRALSILISGEPNVCTPRIGIGKSPERLGMPALEPLMLSDLFLIDLGGRLASAG
jgi:hypothetical protein